MLSKGKFWGSLSQSCHLFMQMADLPKVSKNLERFAVSLWLADWTDAQSTSSFSLANHGGLFGSFLALERNTGP